MYTVYEHTPGYLSEDDDPPVFDTYEDAIDYLQERRRELFDDDYSYSYPPEDKDDGFTRHFELEVSEIDHDYFIYYDKRKTHDLGRIVEIIDVEVCPTCGQPDNCGDCNHATDEQINRSFDAYR